MKKCEKDRDRIIENLIGNVAINVYKRKMRQNINHNLTVKNSHLFLTNKYA